MRRVEKLVDRAPEVKAKEYDETPYRKAIELLQKHSLMRKIAFSYVKSILLFQALTGHSEAFSKTFQFLMELLLLDKDRFSFNSICFLKRLIDKQETRPQPLFFKSWSLVSCRCLTAT